MSISKKEENQKKSYQTRLKIIDAYMELIRFKDFDTITVKAIAERANITRGTFYLYFTDIYDMIAYIEDTLLSNMPSSPAPVQYMVDKLSFPSYEICQENAWEREWFEYYDQYHVYFNTLLGPHGDSSFHGKIKKLIQNALRIRMQQDGMSNDEFQNYFIELIPNLYLLLAKEWTNNPAQTQLDIDAVIKIVNTIRVGALYCDVLNTQKFKTASFDKE